jgi:protein-tyrosine phosphatase
MDRLIRRGAASSCDHHRLLFPQNLARTNEKVSGMTDQQFEVLIVCHANICRSPMAERLIRKSFTERMGDHATGFRVASAGTNAWSNAPMHPFAAEVLREHGADATDFVSRRLSEAVVRRAGLVLTATRRQRSACVALDPSAVRRTFTLLQFGRYAAGLRPADLAATWPPPARLREMIEMVSVVRAHLPVPQGDEDDLPDPVQSPVEVFRRTAAEIQSVVDVMIGLIAPVQTVPR